MNQINVPGMNPHAGGPVGGSMMMNNASVAPDKDSASRNQMMTRFNTYIYDYLIKHKYIDCARALITHNLPMYTDPPVKTSPGRRRDGEVNGVDPDSMDADSKDEFKYPDDMPRPKVSTAVPQSAFVFDWYCLFTDMWLAQRNKGADGPVAQYIQQTQNMQRIREQAQNPNSTMMRPGGPMIPGMTMARGRNDMNTHQAIHKAAMARNMTQQQFQAQQRMSQQHQMQRGDSDIDMNGHRSQSPASAEQSGSPSKRQRLEGNPQFVGQGMVPNGRGQPMNPNTPQQTSQMLMANGIQPSRMTPQQFQNFQNLPTAQQQKSIQVYTSHMAAQYHRLGHDQGMQNGMLNPATAVMQNQGDMMQGPEGQFMNMDQMYQSQLRGNGGMNQQGANTGGNHALQDYQMQLMLLEQQNKKRLMMARQEQEGMARPDGQPALPGQPGMQTAGMSPGNPRNGPSPNPSEQMKRGTPQIGQAGIPGSPAPGDMGQNRGSPAAMNFVGGMPPDFNLQVVNQIKNMGDGMAPGPAPGMRPGMPMGNQPGNRMSSGGNWPQGPQGQPMIGQPTVSQPSTMGTPQQRTEMPPPAQPAGGQNRTQPSSPQPGQAPPTPQQSTKANPKGKKDRNEQRKQKPSKKGSVAANTSSGDKAEAELPQTPTPSTPITPVHAASFTNNAGGSSGPKGGPAATSNPVNASGPNANMQPQGNANGPTSVPVQNQVPQAPGDMQGAAPFGDFPMSDPNQQFNLDFSSLEPGDVLENFDFDSFLNTDNTDLTSFGNFDTNLMDGSGGGFGLGGLGGGMEAGGGVD